MRAPLISVIIPAYNVSEYIAHTVGSVVQQTFTDYEIIVVNDGSPDTPALEAALEPYRDRIVYLTQENGGPSAARNTAIRAARGEYVALLDGDDSWVPEYLEYMLARLREEKLDLLCCDTLFFGHGWRAGHNYMELVPSNGPCNLSSLITCAVNICTSTVLMRRSAAMETGLFNERMRHSEDYDLWTRMAAKGFRLGYDRALLGRRRLRPEGLSANGLKLLLGARQTYCNLLQNPDVPAELHELIHARDLLLEGPIALQTARQSLHRGDTEAALRALRSMPAPHTWRVRVMLALLSVTPSFGPMVARCWDAILLSLAQLRARHTRA